VIDEDREAVRRVQNGETEAFEVLVEKYKRKTFRLAYQVLRDQEEALDVAQEAFIKAFRALPKFKGDSAFYTWLFRITMNLALDRKRQRVARAKSMGTEDVPPEEWERTAVSTDRGPDEEATGAERRDRIARALGSLPEHHRSIIILSDIEGLAYREIAEVLGIPMGTVMSRLHHARKRLREALGAGFAALLLAVGLGLGATVPVGAQPPGYPPPGAGVPGAPPPSGAPIQRVCVYALVILASNAPGPPPGVPPQAGAPRPPPPPHGGPPAAGLTPTPGVKGEDDESSPPASSGGCGQQVRLQPWVPRLQGVFGYSSYEPMMAFEATMPLGMAQRFALPGGRELELQSLAVRPPIVRISAKIRRGPVVEIATVMDVPPRRPALIGGPPHGPGVLIIAIRARVTP
jgi:RNA polymerase sigma-70 factor (ECF subfamily)